MAGAGGVDIKTANTHLLGLWFQCLFAGAYYVYFPQCVMILRRKIRDGMSLWLPLVCGILFVLTTVSLVVEMVRGWTAFSVPDGGPEVRPNPAEFYSHAATPLSLVKNSINVIAGIISDAIIVYRTFIVWNCNYWIIIVPVLVFLADVAMGIWSVITLSETVSGSIFILSEVSFRVRYFYILTFVLNLLCACLICFRIWHLGFKSSPGYNDSRLSHVMGVIIESAGLYCAYLFVLIVTDCLGSNVFFIFLDPTPPVIAIVYSMLIVRSQSPAKPCPPPPPEHAALQHPDAQHQRPPASLEPRRRDQPRARRAHRPRTRQPAHAPARKPPVRGALRRGNEGRGVLR
ncbi:hypothetical protein C8Q80DRAFT_171004 [Daedaleopsis nitida]|nr:hypothetical protein C8Q80DRAFT_171004 [Daedaleopsis nitida]